MTQPFFRVASLFLSLFTFALASAGCPGPGEPEDPADGRACPFEPATSASMTFYGDVAPTAGYCQLAALPTGAAGMIAVDSATYDGASACGTCVEVTKGGITSLAVIGDLCPTCDPGEIDATSGLANTLNGGLVDGIHSVTMRQVECPVTGGLTITPQGANPWYLSLIVSNSPTPIDSVEALDTAAGPISLTRTSDNRWEASGSSYGSGPFTLRVVDIFGDSVDQGGVSLSAATAGDAAFEACAAD
ncbi:MAG: hypothetical protein IT285_12130 [Bdellovibrionales bacterium]|nr:hypothetical protein [Bdellovibrionales bacterium]